MDEHYVTLKELAQEFGQHRSNFRKYILDAGFTFIKVRTPESRNQLTLALSEEDAEAIRGLREQQGFTSCKTIVDNGLGWFYIIQLAPDLSSLRMKLGFASDVDARLRAHHTAAPTAELIKAWPSKKCWEQAVMDCITQEGCTLVANEVFDVTDIDVLVSKGDAFFALMPDHS